MRKLYLSKWSFKHSWEKVPATKLRIVIGAGVFGLLNYGRTWVAFWREDRLGSEDNYVVIFKKSCYAWILRAACQGQNTIAKDLDHGYSFAVDSSSGIWIRCSKDVMLRVTNVFMYHSRSWWWTIGWMTPDWYLWVPKQNHAIALSDRHWALMRLVLGSNGRCNYRLALEG